MTYAFFNRKTANSNRYARENMMENGKCGGYAWVNISVQEMIVFHGVILEMSIDDRNLSGYKSYFDDCIKINCSHECFVTLEDFLASASKYFTLRRSKQDFCNNLFHPPPVLFLFCVDTNL